MGRALRSEFQVSPPAPKRKLRVRRAATAQGSAEFMNELMGAVSDAMSDAVAQTHAAGLPTYTLDANGDLCEVFPGKAPRKLSRAEVEALS